MNINIREAKNDDLDLIISFIKKIAHYEKLDKECNPKRSDLEKWINERKLVKTLILEVDSNPVAFCMYYYNFSTFVGKAGIHIEDIYVDEDYRHQGLGKLLFKEVIKIAKKEDLGRIEWTCLNWNEPSINFYKSINAIAMDEWITFRLTNKEYNKLID